MVGLAIGHLLGIFGWSFAERSARQRLVLCFSICSPVLEELEELGESKGMEL